MPTMNKKRAGADNVSPQPVHTSSNEYVRNPNAQTIVVHNNDPKFMERDKATAAKSATSSPPKWNTSHEAWTPSGPAGGSKPELGSFGGAAHDTHARPEVKFEDLGQYQNMSPDYIAAATRNRQAAYQASMAMNARAQDMGWQDKMTGHSRQARQDDMGYAEKMTGHKVTEDYWKGSLAQQATNEQNRAGEWKLSREDERADVQLERNMAVFQKAFGAQAGDVLSTAEGRAKANDILKTVSDLAKSDKPMEEILPSIVAYTGMLNKLFGVDPEAQGDQSPARAWEDQKPMWEAMKEMGYADARTMNLIIDAMEKDVLKKEAEWLKNQKPEVSQTGGAAGWGKSELIENRALGTANPTTNRQMHEWLRGPSGDAPPVPSLDYIPGEGNRDNPGGYYHPHDPVRSRREAHKQWTPYMEWLETSAPKKR